MAGVDVDRFGQAAEDASAQFAPAGHESPDGLGGDFELAGQVHDLPTSLLASGLDCGAGLVNGHGEPPSAVEAIKACYVQTAKRQAAKGM